jgi:glutaredoxin
MFLLRTCCFLSLLGLAVFNASDAPAQQVYRIVGPDGRVTFSDKPPLEPNAKASAATPSPAAGGSGDSALPFELRQVAGRFPVILYSGPACGPCVTGRSLLASRGVPFTEKTVITNEDIGALGRITGVPTLPVLTIGQQQLKGFSEVEWTKFLDAAGYPTSSILPAGYSGPPATPLVVAQQPAPARATPAPEPPQPAGPPSESPQRPADNPTGIRF